MSQIEAVLFDYDSTLVDGEVICFRTYVVMFREFGTHVDLEEIFARFKGVELYEIIDIISKEQGVTMVQADIEHTYRAEVARLFDTELEDIAGANELLASINVPICVVSNDPVGKVQHSPGKFNMLYHFPEKPFSGYDIQRWKPDPALMSRAAKAMNVNVENCILVDDSSAGVQSGIDTGMGTFYFCADPYNKPIVHLRVTTFTYFSQLPEPWEARGWDIMAQLFTLPSLTPLKLARKGKQREFDTSVSRQVIYHGLYFAALGSSIGVLFLVLHIFFAKEPLILLVIIQVLSLSLLMSITTGAIPAMLAGVMAACLPEKIGSQRRYCCLVDGIGGVVITEIHYAVIVHIKDMASSASFENILSGENLVVRIIPALLAGVVMSRIITRLPELDISCSETDSLS